MRYPVSFSMEYFSLESRRKTEEQLLTDIKARKLKETSCLAATDSRANKPDVTSEICLENIFPIESSSKYNIM